MLDRIRARMFNRGASRAASQPDRIVSALGLKKGARVADLGSGGGYFSLRFASAVGPGGTVYAIDLKLAFLAFVADQARKAGFGNLETVSVPEMAARIPVSSLDLLFCRDVYHHLSDRSAYFQGIANYLRPGGRVAVIDWLPSASRFAGPPAGHRTSPETIIQEMEAAGYSVAERPGFLARQSFIIFRLRKA